MFTAFCHATKSLVNPFISVILISALKKIIDIILSENSVVGLIDNAMGVVEGYINYTSIFYCDAHLSLPGFVFLIFWLIILFATLASTADDFFCPSLEMLSRTFRFSQNVAGVTLLAFGNGAPEIFASLAGTTKQRSDLVISYLLGSGMFLTCVVAGFIIILSPFKMVERPFLRDIIFYLIALFWTFWIFYHRIISLYGAIGFISLYIVYIAVVLISHKIYVKFFKYKDQLNCDPSSSTIVANTQENSFHHTISQIIPTEEDEIIPWGGPVFIRRSWSNSENRKQEVERRSSIAERAFVKSSSFSSISQEESNLSNEDVLENATSNQLVTNCWEEIVFFIRSISPLDKWSEFGSCGKTIKFFRAPIILFLKLTIPVVTNWHRPLNALHCITSSLLLLFSTRYGMIMIRGVVPLWAVVLAGGILCALFVMLTSEREKPPVYHMLFALIGFCASVTWIYILANEIVSLLTTMGMVFGVSDAIVGVTVLVWGNSISDVVADINIAKEGFPRMGLSACFGGPLFNLLLGLGISFTSAAVHTANHVIEVALHRTPIIIMSFLALSLVSSLVVVPLMGFQMHRFYGFYLLFLYLVFLCVIVCADLLVF